MIIIFEGADGAGKTTAAKILINELKRMEQSYVSLRRGPPQRDPLLEYTVDLEHGGDEHTWFVCDRWHWGELIYGPIYRGKSLLTGAGHRAVDEFLARRDALIIHMDAPTQVICDRVQDRGDDFIQFEHLPFIVEEYRRLRDLESPVRRRTLADFDVSTAHTLIQESHAIRRHSGTHH